MMKALTKQGMKIHVGAGVEKLEASKSGVKASIKGKDGKVVQDDFSHAIVAIGIVPNSEAIGLEELGVKTERGHIVVDGYARTNVDGIYAIDAVIEIGRAHACTHVNNELIGGRYLRIK